MATRDLAVRGAHALPGLANGRVAYGGVRAHPCVAGPFSIISFAEIDSLRKEMRPQRTLPAEA
ncbi:hypothetical protein [Streptomyces sp. STR69]|uniref:hypothetical protein n=1 Tax=Streptomyces sp. STR69 TaxID=1796942 RepID=UPI0021CA2414|nr:hypothetical protein [Streptomyces sp. STR69]